ncbi:winged helix-turn-helix domain-containing protein [Yoonia sp. GPGPB17]|uniref:winged helix-turn-helix domain-containing protein n=1 Tax=Yoonia sp. GPGPB17 TaxID=3026147 RepID=UPI0030C44685
MTREVKVRLGLFTYDKGLDCLLDLAGEHVSLRPQSAQVLSLLVENLGRTVTKEELISAVWQNLSVTDDSLTQCIADIRRALGDVDRRILKTRPKVGYMLSPTQVNTDQPEITATPIQETTSDEVPALVCIQTANPQDQPDAKTIEQEAISRGADSRDPVTAGTALFSFAAVTAAVRFALWLSTTPNGSNFCIGVDLAQPDHASADDLRVSGLTAIAGEAQVVVSVEVQDQCYAERDFDFEDLGQHRLKTTQEDVRAFRIHTNTGGVRIMPDIAAEDLLPTIAVVPLRARISSPDTDVIGEIVADDLIATISRSADINVISRLSTTAFRTQTTSLDKIGDTLGADFVLSGTILTHDAKIGMMLQLSEISTSKVLWAERVQIEVTDMLNGLEAVEEIIAKIRKAIALNEIERARSKPISTLRNYTLLIGAVGLMHRLAPVDFNMAGEMLRTLIARAPNHPAALSWMARWHVLRVQQGWSDNPQEEAQLALGFSRKALDIDPENALALISEGLVLTNLSHELEEAEDRYDAALDVNPNDANGRLLRGTLFAFQGRGEEAKRDCERALHLAPLIRIGFSFCHWRRRPALPQKSTSVQLNWPKLRSD